jgi:4-amino-4-deoxy-L-arabinose transferase-like glycosyltransferase
LRSPTARRWRRARVWAIPVLVTLALCLPGLFSPRWAVDMGWYAGISRGIIDRADPWFLHAGEREFFNKPPLAFWGHALALWVFGAHTWAVRVPGILGVCGCVLATVAIVRRLHGARAAMLAGIVAASTPELVRVSTQFRLDVPHTLFMLLALLGVVVSAERERREGTRARLAGTMLLSGAMVGLALLTKPFFGPLVYAFAAPWLIWIGARRTLGWIIPALLLAVLVAAPWHAAMVVHYAGAFIDEYVGRQAIGRALGTSFEADPWWYYLKLIAGTYWPWAAVMALALGALARTGLQPRHRRGQVLALTWLVLWVVAVSIFSDKRRQYILPAYPAMAWLCGVWLAGAARPLLAPLLRKTRLEALVGVGLVASCVLTGSEGLAVWRRPPEGWPRLIGFLRHERPAEVWAGSIDYTHAGMVAALTGLWPRTIDWSESYRTPPPAGALVIYSEKPPPPDAEEVFRSGEVRLVRWPAGEHDLRDHDAPPPGPQPWFVR